MSLMALQQKPPARKAPNHRTASGKIQRARTRALIIKTAIPIFAEHGPDIPVIEDFVKAAGVSRGTFYNYFRTTHDLLQAVMIEVSDKTVATYVPIVADEPNPVIRLATAMRMFYRKALIDPVFRSFLGSVTNIGTLVSVYGRADLEEAIEMGLIRITELDLAEAVALGVIVYALRSPNVESGGMERGLETAKAVLSGLGVHPRLVEQALNVELPALPERF